MKLAVIHLRKKRQVDCSSGVWGNPMKRFKPGPLLTPLLVEKKGKVPFGGGGPCFRKEIKERGGGSTGKVKG